MKPLIFKSYLFFILLFVSACSSHKAIIDNSINQIKNNSLNSETLEKLEVSESSKEYLLFNQELSRISFITDNTNNTLKYSKKATDFYNKLDYQATINAGGVASTLLASSFGNDNNLTYIGSDYERAFDYFYSGLAYLKSNNLESAMIDIRASSDIQKLSTAKREERIIKAQNEINNKKNYNLGTATKSILAENNKILSSTQKSFLNAYIYYVSGNIRELYGDANGAMVDYKLALSVNPNNYYLQQDALRLAKSIDYSYYQDLTKSYVDNNQNYENQATIIVVYEQGFVPKKEEIKGTIIDYKGLVFSIALPVYNQAGVTASNVSVNFNGKTAKLDVISNVYDMARNDLAEKYPIILTRQAARVLSKSVVQNLGQQQIDNNAGLGLLMYGVGSLTALTERADVRSFRTLPHLVQVAKINSDNDINKIKVDINLNKSIEFNNLKVTKGETAIIYVIDTGYYVYKSVIYQSIKR